MGIPSGSDTDAADIYATGSLVAAAAGSSIILRGNFNVSVWGAFSATVLLERSFDAGATFLPVTYSDGTSISYTAPVSCAWSEPEGGVVFRIRVSAYTSGTVNWRLSQGGARPYESPVTVPEQTVAPGLPRSGGSLSGPLYMGGHLLSGSNVAVTGGSVDGVALGATTPASGAFTSLASSGAATFASASSTPWSVSGSNLQMGGASTQMVIKNAGTNGIAFLTGGSITALTLNHTASGANSVRITPGITGNGVMIQAVGDAASKLILAAGTGGTAGSIQVNTPAQVQGGFQFGKNSAFASGSAMGPPGSTNVAPYWCNISLSGSIDTGGSSPFMTQIMDTMTMTPSMYTVWSFTNQLNAGHDGPRNAFSLLMKKTSAAATPAGPAGGGWWYTLGQLFMVVTQGDGGTQSAPYGQYTLLNPDLTVDTGDWVYNATNSEFDLRVRAGTKTPQKIIHALNYGITDGSHASPKTGNPATAYTDAAIQITASSTIGNGSGKGLTMLQFGSFPTDIPWDTTAGAGTSLMRVWLNVSRNLTAASNAYIDNGFSLSDIYVRGKFLDNGSFSVDGPTGTVATGPAKLGPATSGASLDVSGYVATSATVASSGSAVYVGSQITDAFGGIWEVATISGTFPSSTATSVTMKRAPVVASVPSNPVSGILAGSDGGIRLNITWSSLRSTLSLQPSGGGVMVGPGMMSANGSVATAMSSLGPTGSHTTVQEWLTITNATGVTRYIPCF